MARKPQPRKVKKDQLEKDQDEIPADKDKKEADNDKSPASPPPIQRKTLTGTDVGSDDEREDLEDKSQQEPKKGQDKTAGVDDSLDSEPKPGKETSKTKKKGTKATKPKQEPKKGQVETAGVDDSLDSKPKPGKETSKTKKGTKATKPKQVQDGGDSDVASDDEDDLPAEVARLIKTAVYIPPHSPRKQKGSKPQVWNLFGMDVQCIFKPDNPEDLPYKV